jgi:hypothetical protein
MRRTANINRIWSQFLLGVFKIGQVTAVRRPALEIQIAAHENGVVGDENGVGIGCGRGGGRLGRRYF